MSDPRADRDAYLEQVAARLRLPESEAGDVLEELRGHLAESVSDLMREGLTPEQAERGSVARLGNPGELADGIRTARQTRRRMLAAAGAGAVAATSGLFWGWLFAAALSTVAGVGATLIISLALQWLHLSTPGWQPPDILSVPFALFVPGYAGHRLVGAVATASGRSVGSIKRPIAVGGGILVAIVAIFVVSGELDQLSVLTHVAVPIGFAGGAILARDAHSVRLRRLPGRWVAAIVIVTTLTLTAAAAATLRINPNDGYHVDDGEPAIGPPATDVLGDGWLDQQTSTGLGFVSGVTLTPEPPTLLAEWR
ncbi:MAG TPA: permease prefix domain 1-containing protein, partial [Methylomirabilota bacterium]|nr:permease prefix domain 1-containing protein [Methylomirabilota bacterium]